MTAPTRIAGLIAAQLSAQGSRLRIAAAAGAVVSVAAVCLLGLSGWFITAAAFAGLAGAATAHAFNYMMPSAIIRLLAILRTGARYVERVAGHEAALKALARLRPQVFDAVANAPTSRALSVSSGEASARFIQDVDAIQTLFVRRSAPFSLGAGAVSAVLLAALASPFAGLSLLLAMIVACGGCVVIARRFAAPAGREVQIAVGALKDRLASLEAVAPELKAYALDRWAVQEVEQAAAVYDRARIRHANVGAALILWLALTTAAAVGVVVASSTGASAPMIALAILAAFMGMESAGGLATALRDDGAAREALDRLDAVTPQQAPTRPDYARGDTIILAGEPLSPPARLGIAGPSGCGKTTLAEQLIGLRDPSPVPPHERALFAYAAQDVRLLDGTIRENLLLAGPADDETLWQALSDAGLADRVHQSSAGLDAPIGPNGQRLSGGERRRLGLARAYLRTAAWLVLDEPTEGLDADTEAAVLAALEQRLRATGQGLVLISHRDAPLALCERIHRMNSGERPVAEAGLLPAVA